MKDEAAANADADKEAKEKVEVLNQADSLVFQTEKQMKEFGDKIPEDKKAPIEAAIATLKEAHAAQDIDGCKAGIEGLNQAFSAASEEMYKASQEAAVPALTLVVPTRPERPTRRSPTSTSKRSAKRSDLRPAPAGPHDEKGGPDGSPFLLKG